MATKNPPESAEQTAATGRRNGGRFPAGNNANPDGRRGKRQDAAPAPPPGSGYRFDGWYSLLTGLGTAGRDKRESMQFAVDRMDWRTAEVIWQGDDLAARIIQTLPDEMMREGYDLCITDQDSDDGTGPDDEYEQPSSQKVKSETAMLEKMGAAARGKHGPRDDLKKEVEHQWEELGLMDRIHEALCYERAYGGAAILIGAFDGSIDLEQPLVAANVRSVDFLTTLEPRELQPVAWYGDPRAKKFGEPAIFQLTANSPGTSVGKQTFEASTRIHESRLIVFGGIRVTRRINALNSGWGDSILTRVYRILRDYNLVWAAAGSLVCDFAQAVYKMKGLNDLLQEDGKDIFKNRMIGMDMSRSIARTTMIDSEDDFTRITTPITGLPEMIDRFTQRLCMASGYPLPLLAGESPGGLNASGASGDQLRMFYDSARSKQKRVVVPIIRRVTTLIMNTLGDEPAQWTVEPRALWQPTQKEQIETRKTQCDIDCAYADRDMLSKEEIRASRWGGQSYGFDTKLIAEPEIAQPTADEVAAYAAEQAAASPKTTGPSIAPGGAKSGQTAPVPVATIAKPSASAPVTANTGAPGVDLQKQALNGAQTQAMMEVIKAVVAKEIPIETAQIMLELSFQLSPADAQRMLAPCRNFEAPKPDPVPAFGGGGAPPAFGGGKPTTQAPPKPEDK